MALRWKWRTSLCALLATVCAMLAPGCASWQGPRIDPSGERILIWPGQQTIAPPPSTLPPTLSPFGAPAAPPPLAPAIMAPPPPPPTIGLPPGNLLAPPVYPDAGLPAAPPPVITVPPTSPPAAVSVVPFALPPAVDAQWAFPAPTIAQSGYPLVLTTLVTRRSDRAPLAGWVVRYEVTSADASLGSAGGNRIDVATDATGRASAEIRPMSTGGGQAVVSMAVLQPPAIGTVAASPSEPTLLEIGRGTSSITWRDGVPGGPPPLAYMPSPTLAGPTTESPTFPPPPAVEGPAPNRFEPPPSLSNDSSPPPPTYGSSPPSKTYGPPPKQEPAGKPELVVDVRRRGPESVSVGGYVSFDVVVTNRGESTARHIKLLDRFDAGLIHPSAKENELSVTYDRMRDLPPGESEAIPRPLTFGVQAAGRLCHYVTVTADDAAPASGSGCVTAVDAKPVSPPTIEVTKQGPTRHYVGELAKFRIVIKNTGDVPVTNLEVIDSYDEAFDPRYTDAGREILPDGSFKWRIARLEKDERREINVQCTCVTPSRSACSRVIVTADGDVRIAENKCVEILPLAAAAPSAAGAVAPPPALSDASLKLSMSSTANPARVGGPMTLFVFVENAGQQLERGVTLRVLVPQETTPNASLIRPAGTFQIVGQREIRFDNLGELPPGERRQIEIPLQVDRPGVVTFWAEVDAAGMAKPINTESDPIQIEAASQ